MNSMMAVRNEIQSVHGLIDAYYEKNPHGHYFDHDTLKLFGERVSEMRLLKKKETITDVSGVKHECYVLSSLQRKHPCGPRREYTYFDVDTLDDVVV